MNALEHFRWDRPTQYVTDLNISPFTVEIHLASPAGTCFEHEGKKYATHFACQKGEDPLELALAVSRLVPFIVVVTAFARHRAVFQAGKCIREYPDLNHFYNNITPAQQRAWATCSPIPEGR